MGIYDFINKTSNEKQLSYFDKTAVLGIQTENTSSRPSDGFLSMNKESETILAENIHSVRYSDLYNLSKISDVLQIIFNTRARKTFREGFDIESEFESANPEQKVEIENWLNKCNDNGQSFKEVCHELDKDLNWSDDAYLLCLKDYGYNSEGVIVVSEPKEFMRVHPLSIELQMDQSKRLGRFQEGKDTNSNIAYFNPFNRNSLTVDAYDKKTGKQNLQAHYRMTTESGFKYYNSSEIMHKSAFNPSLTYGYSPLFSLYQKVLVLMLQDSYIKKYYGDDKPTKGLLVFNTANKTALMKTFDEIRQKTQKNPHGVKPIIAESSDGRKPVEYIDMAKTLNEMQFTAQRDEYRQQIGAMYGVSPLFQNDMSTGGGLNNEGLQITVTNEVIQERQQLFNNSFLKFMFVDNLGFTDWKVTVKPDIEQDEMAEETLQAQRLANARTKLELGLKGRMTKDGDIVFDTGELEVKEPEQDLNPFDFGKSEVVKSAVVDFQKADDGISPEAKELDKKLTKELKSIFDELDIKGKPNEKQLIKAVGKVSKKLEKQLKKSGSSVFKGIYEKFAKETNKKLGIKTQITDSDKEVIDSLINDDKYKEAFSNMSIASSKRLRETISKAFDKDDISINNLIKDIQEDLEATKSNLRMIVRTETGKIASGARKEQLNKTGAEYKYFHIGPSDNRTTELSKTLVNKTKNGVTWDEYIKLMQNESSKYFPEWVVNPQAPLSHYSSRHTFNFRRVNT